MVISHLDLPIKEFSYINPLVVGQALGMTVWFSQLEIGTSKIINTVASSAFAVYLFHNNHFVFPYYKELCQRIYGDYSGVACATVMFGAMLAVFCMAVAIDRIRAKIWQTCGERLCRGVGRVICKIG